MSDDHSRHATNGKIGIDSSRNMGSRTQNNANNSKCNSQKKNEMAYHYAGKVHVRGLLRRVWRPRYLALGDDGYLRYHESIPPIFQQPGSQYNHNMYNMAHHTHRPKSILAILDGARTINPYSVVDQHVALPQGVHGFVFRGRPVELSTSTAGIGRNSSVRDAVIVPPRQKSKNHLDKHEPAKAVVNAIFPKGTSRRKTAQKLAKAAINPDVLCGIGRNCERGPGSLDSSSSSLMGYEQAFLDDEDADSFGDTVDQCHSFGGLSNRGPNHFEPGKPRKDNSNVLQVHVQAASIQSREYLCAVSTAAEAESWVVALRWAAERRRIHREQKRMGRHDGISTGQKFTSLGIGIDDKLIIVGTADENNTSVLGGYGEDSKESLASTEDGWCKAEDEKRVSDNAEQLTSQGETTKQSVLKKAAEPSSSFQSFSMVTEEPSLALVESKTDESANIDSVLTPTPKAKHLLNSLLLEKEIHPPKLFDENRSSKFSAGAVTVVTKVGKFRLRSNTSVNHAIPIPLPGEALDINYEIKLLVLQHCHINQVEADVNEGRRNNHTMPANLSYHPQSIEERTISKSIQAILRLIKDLKLEFDATDRHENCVSENLPSKSDTLQLLEELESSLMAVLNFSRKTSTAGLLTSISEIIETHATVISTVETVNRAMRYLSTNSAVCSSHRFQDFLCLRHSNSTQMPCIINGQPKIRTYEGSVDQIVRAWLAQNDKPSFIDKSLLCLAITWHHPFGGPVFSLISIWLSLRSISVIFFLISNASLVISIPIETYVTLVAASFFYGLGIGRTRSRPGIDAFELSNADSPGRPEQNISKEASSLPCHHLSDHLADGDDDDSTVVDDIMLDTNNAFMFPEIDSSVTEPYALSSPLPKFPENKGVSCWSKPDHNIFLVRSKSYLVDRLKMPSSPEVFECRGVDIWLTDNAERNISRHPSMLGGKLHEQDTFIVNFLLPFANLVAYFSVKPVEEMPRNVAKVWQAFVKGDQEYRDGKLKLLPVVVDGPWIVKKAVGPGTSPAMIGRDLPLQYYFTEPTITTKGVYEVDVLVTASRIARGILNVVKGHTKSLTIAFAFIIEAAEQVELPETVLCAFQVHSLHLEDCPRLPEHLLGDPCD
ncbi:hypothetical protein ACHAWX_004216 [Stephanocyclus meneghinianus]